MNTQRVDQDMKSLYKTRKADLVQIARRSHRVADFRDAGKDTLISMIIRARYGDRAVNAWMDEQS